MVKMVIMDLYGKKREAFQKAWNTSMFFNYVFLSTVFTRNYEDIVCAVNILFLMIVIFIHTMYKNYLPKAMYFMPLNEKQRESYLRTAFWVKAGGLFILHLCINIGLVAFKLLDWKLALAMLLVMNLWSGIISVTMKQNRTVKERYRKAMRDIVIEIILHIVCFFEFLLVPSLKVEEITAKDIVFFVILGSIQMILYIYIVKKNFKYMVSMGKNYEELYGTKSQENGKVGKVW